MEDTEKTPNRYACLREMPIEKLLELLKSLVPFFASTPEEEEFFDALGQAIIEKESKENTGFFPDVDQQWREFVAYMMPKAEDTEFCELDSQ